MRAFGKDGDMSAYAPKAHLGSAVIIGALTTPRLWATHWPGNGKAGAHWWGVKEGAIDLLKIADDVPQEITTA